MRYAVVVKGVVVNVAVADEPQKANWIQSGTVQRGDEYDEDSGTFRRPEKPLSPAQLRLLERSA